MKKHQVANAVSMCQMAWAWTIESGEHEACSSVPVSQMA